MSDRTRYVGLQALLFLVLFAAVVLIVRAALLWGVPA